MLNDFFVLSLLTTLTLGDNIAIPQNLVPGAEKPIEFLLGNETHVFNCTTNGVDLVISVNSGQGVIDLEVTNEDWDESEWTGNRTTNRNPGITVQRRADESKYFTIRVKRDMDFDEENIKVESRISAIAYTSLDSPTPGACAPTSEFALAESTMIVRPVDYSSVSVTAFPAMIAPAYSVHDRLPRLRTQYGACDFAEAPLENSNPSYDDPLVYQLWYLYINECGSSYEKVFDDGALFDSVKKMTTLKGIHKYGHLQPSTYLRQKPVSWGLDITAGQGVVYNVVVFDKSAYTTAKKTRNVTEDQFKAVYSPYSTYHCSRGLTVNCSGVPSPMYCDIYPECGWDFATKTCVVNQYFPLCETLFDPYVMMLYMILGLLGAFVALLGHRYFKAELIIFGFFIGASGTYIGLSYVGMETAPRLGLTVVGGVVGGFLFLYTWFFFKGVAVTMVVIGIVHGNFVTSMIFATSLGELDMWLNPFNFWMTYACLVLLWPIVMLLKDRVGNVLATSVAGSYCILLAVNFFVPSSFDDILINTLQRAVNPSFAMDYTGNYFSATFNGCSNVELNVAMLVVWIGLTIVTFLFQWVCLDGRNRDVPFSSSEIGCCDGCVCCDAFFSGIFRPLPPLKDPALGTYVHPLDDQDTRRCCCLEAAHVSPTQNVEPSRRTNTAGRRTYVKRSPKPGRRSFADPGGGRPLTMIGGRDFDGHSDRRFSRPDSNQSSSEPTVRSRWSDDDNGVSEIQSLYASPQRQRQPKDNNTNGWKTSAKYAKQQQQQQQQQQQMQRHNQQVQHVAQSAPTNYPLANNGDPHPLDQNQNRFMEQQPLAQPNPTSPNSKRRSNVYEEPNPTPPNSKRRSSIYEDSIYADADDDLIADAFTENEIKSLQKKAPKATGKQKKPPKKNKSAKKSKSSKNPTSNAGTSSSNVGLFDESDDDELLVPQK